MSKKLKLNPNVAYVLGLYAYNKGKAVGIATNNTTIIERFTKTAMDEFGIEPNKILFEEKEDEQVAYFYNSKLKKLFDKTLERKTVVFKYKNDYSANYFAGIFDMKGGKDGRGYYIKELDETDSSILEKLGMHTEVHNGRIYFVNQGTFMTFIKPFSSKFTHR